MAKKVIIVGAGVGGLAAAARLAYDGHRVEVFEKLPRCGGRASLLESQGFKFDMGPSFVLMPGFFREVFSYCGERIDDYLKLQPLQTSYKIFYRDGDSLTVFQDREATKAQWERMEKGAAARFDACIAHTGAIYKEVEPLLYRCVTPADLINPRYWFLLGKIDAFRSYWQLAKKFFKDPKLCFAFTFEAMFIGVSPYRCPAFYSVISYADHAQKIFHPMGGMYQIPLALEKMARKFGAQFNYDASVASVRRKNGMPSVVAGGQEEAADAVVVNADYAYARTCLLGRSIPPYRYSCSVYLVYLGLKKKIKGLSHHNLFFSGDLARNLAQIFDEYALPDDPSFYVHAPTVTDPSLAPEGKEILYLLVPVPNLERGEMDGYEARLRAAAFARINAQFGIKIEELIEVEHRFYPRDFITRYNIRNAATFGLSHTLMQSAFFRPANFDRKSKSLYFVGASTQPGGGLPVVIAGSKIVADLINAE